MQILERQAVPSPRSVLLIGQKLERSVFPPSEEEGRRPADGECVCVGRAVGMAFFERRELQFLVE